MQETITVTSVETLAARMKQMRQAQRAFAAMTQE